MNREIVDYMIVTKINTEDLVETINALLKTWRQPLWSPSSESLYYTQAMVKYAPLPDTTDNE